MRQRMYSRAGNGSNGARRYQSRARKLQVRRSRSTARRGRTSARNARRAISEVQLAGLCMASVYSAPMTLASGVAAGSIAHPLAGYRSEFPIFRDRIYLNTCSLGPLGDRARRKVAGFLDVWQARGAAAWYDVWWEALAELRSRYGAVIGAGADTIALAPSVSVAVAAVASAL